METHILHDVLPHPQPFFLHLHHIVLLVLRVVDLLQLAEGSEQMLSCQRDAEHIAAVSLKKTLTFKESDKTAVFSNR